MHCHFRLDVLGHKILYPPSLLLLSVFYSKLFPGHFGLTRNNSKCFVMRNRYFSSDPRAKIGDFRETAKRFSGKYVSRHRKLRVVSENATRRIPSCHTWHFDLRRVAKTTARAAARMQHETRIKRVTGRCFAAASCLFLVLALFKVKRLFSG